MKYVCIIQTALLQRCIFVHYTHKYIHRNIYIHTPVSFYILFLYSTYSTKHYMFHSFSRLEVNEQAFSHICTEQIIFFTVHDKLKEHLSDRPICQSTTKCWGSFLCIILHAEIKCDLWLYSGYGQSRLQSPKESCKSVTFSECLDFLGLSVHWNNHRILRERWKILLYYFKCVYACVRRVHVWIYCGGWMYVFLLYSPN